MKSCYKWIVWYSHKEKWDSSTQKDSQKVWQCEMCEIKGNKEVCSFRETWKSSVWQSHRIKWDSSTWKLKDSTHGMSVTFIQKKKS